MQNVSVVCWVWDTPWCTVRTYSEGKMFMVKQLSTSKKELCKQCRILLRSHTIIMPWYSYWYIVSWPLTSKITSSKMPKVSLKSWTMNTSQKKLYSVHKREKKKIKSFVVIIRFSLSSFIEFNYTKRTKDFYSLHFHPHFYHSILDWDHQHVCSNLLRFDT